MRDNLSHPTFTAIFQDEQIEEVCHISHSHITDAATSMADNEAMF